jgi:uncharacterized protein YajQ (UPF0234 family)
MASSFSFDVVSELNFQEVDNAVNQASKEIAQRYDFRDANASIDYSKTDKKITLKADGEEYVSAMYDVLVQKCIKRGISVMSFQAGKMEHSGGKVVRQTIELRSGLDKEDAKKVNKLIKDSKIKVQTQIQDDIVRVTGKSKDDLQEAITLLKQADLPFPLQFVNYR